MYHFIFSGRCTGPKTLQTHICFSLAVRLKGSWPNNGDREKKKKEKRTISQLWNYLCSQHSSRVCTTGAGLQWEICWDQVLEKPAICLTSSYNDVNIIIKHIRHVKQTKFTCWPSDQHVLCKLLFLSYTVNQKSQPAVTHIFLFYKLFMCNIQTLQNSCLICEKSVRVSYNVVICEEKNT